MFIEKNNQDGELIPTLNQSTAPNWCLVENLKAVRTKESYPQRTVNNINQLGEPKPCEDYIDWFYLCFIPSSFKIFHKNTLCVDCKLKWRQYIIFD